VKSILKKISFIGIFFSTLFSFWFAIHNDLNFTSDIARDFLLFNEIYVKKIVLIGPKSSVAGLFHGPAWLYLNFPAYLIGNGNPVTIEYFWIILTVLFVYSCYYVGKKLFDANTGYLFAMTTSLYMFFHINEFFNPLGAMLLIPINFYLFVRYTEKHQLKFLIPYILILGIIIQFELAIGIPLFILSAIYLLISLIKTKERLHIFCLFLVIIPLSNFIIFDLRHQFILTHALLRYLSPQSGDSIKYNYLYMLFDRLKLMTINVEILRSDPFYRNAVTGLITIIFLVIQFLDNKYKKIYLLLLYFYVGFFVLSLINKGPILYFYFFPLFPIIFLIFSSFVTSKYKYVFLIIFFVVYIMNFSTAISDMQTSKTTIGISQQSWKFLNNMASQVYKGKEKEFGYFVYTPDVIAYAPKYALSYEQRFYKNKVAFYFQKKPVTYIIVAPPAASDPYFSYNWWKTQRLKININPVSTLTFPNGYKIEKYNLNPNQIAVPFDPGIDPGLTFR